MSLADEVVHGVDGISQLRALMSSGRKPGILVSLNFDFVEVEPGRAAFEGKPDDHVYNPIGSVHGGYAATLLDSACGCAVHSSLSATQAYATLELKVAYHKVITRDTGVLRAEGRVVSIGRRAAFAEATLTDSKGRLYATATSTLLVFERERSKHGVRE
ncbi:MAG TPA: PaaI family thioesterase [Terriglobia bacterium]|nr:PaaI family thioesterase [Terriglobia bacterium]